MGRRTIQILSLFFIIAIGFLLRKLGVAWFTYFLFFLFFVLSGLIVVPLMANAKKGKKAYDLYGGLIAFVVLHLIVYLWLPKYFGLITGRTAFWVFEASFVIANCALLGHTTFTIFSVKVATVILVFSSFIAMSAPLFKPFSRFAAEVEKYAIESPIVEAIYKTQVHDIDNLAKPIHQRIEFLQRKAESGNFSEQDRSELHDLRMKLSGLDNVYPGFKNGKAKIDSQVQTFQVIPGEITHTGILPEKGMAFNFRAEDGKSYYFVNGKEKNIHIKGSKTIWINTSGPQEIQLTGDKVSVKAFVSRVH